MTPPVRMPRSAAAEPPLHPSGAEDAHRTSLFTPDAAPRHVAEQRNVPLERARRSTRASLSGTSSSSPDAQTTPHAHAPRANVWHRGVANTEPQGEDAACTERDPGTSAAPRCATASAEDSRARPDTGPAAAGAAKSTSPTWSSDTRAMYTPPDAPPTATRWGAFGRTAGRTASAEHDGGSGSVLATKGAHFDTRSRHSRAANAALRRAPPSRDNSARTMPPAERDNSGGACGRGC